MGKAYPQYQSSCVVFDVLFLFRLKLTMLNRKCPLVVIPFQQP